MFYKVCLLLEFSNAFEYLIGNRNAQQIAASFNIHRMKKHTIIALKYNVCLQENEPKCCQGSFVSSWHIWFAVFLDGTCILPAERPVLKTFVQ
ncbi:hypothetical protein P5673_007814 [Acropora cervicornis]|uniref:Uncharacterized protein n=1 Tax=Acropora cervicornis TaxID=6130 RepID=A0AAD9QUS6_ACRCE|nr:hypothetical protein P5673_007814 [Acropora cervicornis]